MRVPYVNGQRDDAKKILWTYLPSGALSTVGDTRGRKSTYTYDANGNLKTALEARGLTKASEVRREVDTAYDTLDRLTKARNRQPGSGDWTTTSYGYDLNGNLATRVDDGTEKTDGTVVTAGRTQTFSYDNADWLMQQIDNGKQSGCADDRRITNTFTATGWEQTRLIEKTGAGCTSSAPNWQSKQKTSWTWAAGGDLKSLLTEAWTGSPANPQTVESHTLSYVSGGVYVNGNRVRDDFVLKGPDASVPCDVAADNCANAYTYDARDRLTQDQSIRQGSSLTTTYDLFPSGDIHTKTLPTGATVTYDYQGTQLLHMTTVAGSTTTETTYRYKEGNLKCVLAGTGAGVSTCDLTGTGALNPAGPYVAVYNFDSRDRLDSQRSITGDASYTYDPLDRLDKEVESHTGTSASTRRSMFTYLGLTGAESSEQHFDAAAPTANRLATKEFSYDAYGERVAMSDTRGTTPTSDFSYAYNVHGDVSLLIKDAGAAQAAYGYDAYGETDPALTREMQAGSQTQPTQGKTDPLNPFQYSARRFDSGSGSFDMGARRYGPDTSRFLQQDKYEDALSDLMLSADPISGNRYALGAGNPIGGSEWDGHNFITDAANGAAHYAGSLVRRGCKHARRACNATRGVAHGARDLGVGLYQSNRWACRTTFNAGPACGLPGLSASLSDSVKQSKQNAQVGSAIAHHPVRAAKAIGHSYAQTY
jgi:RHS repeat-associated protein